MTIRSLSIQLVTLPLDLEIGGRAGVLPALDYVLVELRDASGEHGVGHSFGLFPGEADAIRAAVERLAEHVVGLTAGDPAHVWARLRDVPQAGDAGAAAAAMSAIDVAVWDLRGRQLGQPVHRLLGASREVVPVYASHDLWEGRTPAELARSAEALVAQGFRALKIRTGGSTDPRREAERLRAVREAVGPGVHLMYDALQYYAPHEAIAIGRALEAHDLFWLEDPVDESDVEGLARVSDALDVPVASGESLVLPEAFTEPLERRAQDIVMVDLKWVGGITPWLRVAKQAARLDLPVVSHLQTQASAHVLAGIPGGQYLEYLPWGFELFEEPPVLRDGAWVPGEAPGLGLTLRAGHDAWHRLA